MIKQDPGFLSKIVHYTVEDHCIRNQENDNMNQKKVNQHKDASDVGII